MFAEFMFELRQQMAMLVAVLKTREFWIYFGVIFFLVSLAGIGVYFAAGFDPLTRGQLGMSFSCRTGQGQLATIIIGGFVFAMVCVVTLGEIINVLEALRQSKVPGRIPTPVSFKRALMHVAATLIIAVLGLGMMSRWCF